MQTQDDKGNILSAQIGSLSKLFKKAEKEVGKGHSVTIAMLPQKDDIIDVNMVKFKIKWSKDGSFRADIKNPPFNNNDLPGIKTTIKLRGLIFKVKWSSTKNGAFRADIVKRLKA